jgi:hypothetical protein
MLRLHAKQVLRKKETAPKEMKGNTEDGAYLGGSQAR